MPRSSDGPGAQAALFESKNLLYYGDNLYVLREHILDESIDLIYLDPPFNKGRNYNVLFTEKTGAKAQAQEQAFEDTWRWDKAAIAAYQETVRSGPPEVSTALQAFKRLVGGSDPNKGSDMLAYLAMMAPRLVELRRVLRPSGSIYLHCDPTASHYLKLLMDAVFGPRAFRNEIVWRRTTAHSGAKKYAPVHDTLLYYSKGPHPKWNTPRTEYDQAYLDKYYRFDDGDGRLYWRADLCAAGVVKEGSSGKAWRGFDPGAKGMHWKFGTDTLDRLDREGRIYWPPGGTGWPQYKRHRDELKGKVVTDIWDDINRINPVGNERLRWPTQKPLALLDRIIEASSDEGDTVLDPFCGCGTSVSSAQALKRRWVGIDIAKRAIGIIEERLLTEYGDEITGAYEVRPEPASVDDAHALADDDKHAFQDWALRRLGGGHPTHKRGADKGIDGRMYYFDEIGGEPKLIIVSVKGGKTTGVGAVRDLAWVMKREQGSLGVLVCRRTTPTPAMQAEAGEAGYYHAADRMIPKLQIVSVEQLFQDGPKIDLPFEAVAMPVSADLVEMPRAPEIPIARAAYPSPEER